MSLLFEDLRFALRLLRREPGFTAVAVLTLALGIGGNAAIFTVIDDAMFRWREAFSEPDRLTMLWETVAGDDLSQVAPENFRDWRDSSGSFAQMAAYFYEGMSLTGHGAPQHLLTAAVSGRMFSMLGVEALHGQTLSPHFSSLTCCGAG